MQTKRLTHEELDNQIYHLEYRQQLYISHSLEDLKKAVSLIEEKTEPLKDIVLLIKLIDEKVHQHNGQLRQRAGKMKTIGYRRNHVQGY